MIYDVAVIGGGVVGGLIARELTKYDQSVVIVEAKADVGGQASSANSGIVHAGFDAKAGSLKAHYNVRGNAMMEGVCKELGVKFIRNTSLVLGYDEEERATLHELVERGKANGVPGLSVISGDEVRAREPEVSDDVTCALLAETGGIVCPHTLTIQAVGNAMDNGATLVTDFAVTGAARDADSVFTLASDKGEIKARYVVNACGLGSGKLAELLGHKGIEIGARRGEYVLLDRGAMNVKATLFRCPGKGGKGVLVSPTADGNIILGPTADEIENGATNATTQAGLAFVMERSAGMVKRIPRDKIITSFSGTRAYSSVHDFIIGESDQVKNLFNVAGVESPGLTSSPAIAVDVAEAVSKALGTQKRTDFNPIRRSYDFFKEASVKEKNAIIASDPEFGQIVCRCEVVTAGEIRNAIRTNPPARTTDGVKRRVRAGMGRCQSGFCLASTIELIAKECGIEMSDVTKKGKGSEHVYGQLK